VRDLDVMSAKQRDMSGNIPHQFIHWLLDLTFVSLSNSAAACYVPPYGWCALSNTAICPSVRPSVYLPYAPSSKTAHFRALVTVEQ